MSKSADVIAIDGPSASGKSTVARGVARALGWIYVDSGAVYRGVTWRCLQLGVDCTDAAAVQAALHKMDWQFFVRDSALFYTVDGAEPGLELRSQSVREAVSDIAANPVVRTFLVGELRAMRRFGALVMEGRDIGSVVFPETPFKFYLDADPAERARRRNQEIVQMEGRGDESQTLQSLSRRDHKDSHRAVAPLTLTADAERIDSTAMSADVVIAHILRRVNQEPVP